MTSRELPSTIKIITYCAHSNNALTELTLDKEERLILDTRSTLFVFDACADAKDDCAFSVRASVTCSDSKPKLQCLKLKSDLPLTFELNLYFSYRLQDTMSTPITFAMNGRHTSTNRDYARKRFLASLSTVDSQDTVEAIRDNILNEFSTSIVSSFNLRSQEKVNTSLTYNWLRKLLG